jgi:hypothetical protein
LCWRPNRRQTPNLRMERASFARRSSARSADRVESEHGDGGHWLGCLRRLGQRSGLGRVVPDTRAACHWARRPGGVASRQALGPRESWGPEVIRLVHQRPTRGATARQIVSGVGYEPGRAREITGGGVPGGGREPRAESRRTPQSSGSRLAVLAPPADCARSPHGDEATTARPEIGPEDPHRSGQGSLSRVEIKTRPRSMHATKRGAGRRRLRAIAWGHESPQLPGWSSRQTREAAARQTDHAASNDPRDRRRRHCGSAACRRRARVMVRQASNIAVQRCSPCGR